MLRDLLLSITATTTTTAGTATNTTTTRQTNVQDKNVCSTVIISN